MIAALRGAALVACLLLPAAAPAQVGGSIVAESDYRFRGISLSGERPNLRLSLSYDHASGAYGGLMLTGIEVERGDRYAGVQAYAGITGSAGAGLRWEAGGTLSRTVGRSPYDYGEAFAALLGEDWSLRLYVAPNYFGWGQRTLYAEFDRGWPLAPEWRLVGHLGALQQLGGGAARRLDARLGVALQVEAATGLQLAWLLSGREGPFPAPYEYRRSTLLLSASYTF